MRVTGAGGDVGGGTVVTAVGRSPGSFVRRLRRAWRRGLGGDTLACEPCRDCQSVTASDADRRDRLRQEVVDLLCRKRWLVSETAVHVCIESSDGGEEVYTLSVDVAVVVTTGEVTTIPTSIQRKPMTYSDLSPSLAYLLIWPISLYLEFLLRVVLIYGATWPRRRGRAPRTARTLANTSKQLQ